ncbi:hypothetical protein PM10SUCC1_33180 [Propionigenium maris DSM 9537]|uniref:Mechanosensitive ion channel MscS domain-containing protein n=1 Tax=Propionigenium maris DSM 9537 TaxID=1123000 RepID=A0A9W6GMH7_9FUSO|nr:mechanosensitive ion channel domain-containing protein [Propionigenium maris]GLI57804.1 hypothetical protein PM10SUCC1_33180 [Propionigenium maris DSM 9537]
MNNFSNVLVTLIILVGMYLLNNLVKKIVISFGQRNKLGEERVFRAVRFINFFVAVVVASGLLLVWGVHPKEFFLIVVTVFTIMGTAFFAAWSNLSNISSGVILFFSYDLRIGDRIKIGIGEDVTIGRVKEMNLFHVEVRTDEGDTVIQPNNLMIHQKITIMKGRRREGFDYSKEAAA